MFFYFIYRNKKLNLISNWKPCVNIRHNLMSKDSHPERFQAVIWSYMTYLLTAIGLTTGGSSTVHINTQTIQRTTHSTRAIHRTIQFTNQEECGPCAVMGSYTLAFALQRRKNHGKTSVRVVNLSQDIDCTQNKYWLIVPKYYITSNKPGTSKKPQHYNLSSHSPVHVIQRQSIATHLKGHMLLLRRSPLTWCHCLTVESSNPQFIFAKRRKRASRICNGYCVPLLSFNWKTPARLSNLRRGK